MTSTSLSLPSLSPAYLPAGCVARVVNDAGRTFNVVLVASADPLVEWYDATYEGVHGVGPWGQFVASYCYSTLTGQDRWSYDYRQGSRGLSLDGGEPLWRVSGANVRETLAAVASALGGAL